MQSDKATHPVLKSSIDHLDTAAPFPRSAHATPFILRRSARGLSKEHLARAQCEGLQFILSGEHEHGPEEGHTLTDFPHHARGKSQTPGEYTTPSSRPFVKAAGPEIDFAIW